MAATAHTDPQPFAFRCSVEVFPADERAALEKHGTRLEALANGAARPESPAEEHFLKVDRDEADPKTLLERAWVRLKGRREFEAEGQQNAAPPPKPEDYGMVEFDADRCWW
jgi:uncharacterized protein YifE (UPF0438 family)